MKPTRPYSSSICDCLWNNYVFSYPTIVYELVVFLVANFVYDNNVIINLVFYFTSLVFSNFGVFKVKAHYFQGMCMFECIPPQTFERFLHIMLEYNLGNELEKNYFISFHKVGDWTKAC
jgi:hypothetical protein